MNNSKRISDSEIMDDKSPVKTACVYERRLTDVEKLLRKTDILVDRLHRSETQNNELIEAQKSKEVEIKTLKSRVAEMELRNRKLAEKLVKFEENELLELLLTS